MLWIKIFNMKYVNHSRYFPSTTGLLTNDVSESVPIVTHLSTFERARLAASLIKLPMMKHHPSFLFFNFFKQKCTVIITKMYITRMSFI
jgi:hypothetical protein